MVYQPVVLDRLRGFGILDKVEKLAHLNREGIYWREIGGKELGHLPMPEDEHVLLFGQWRMNELLLEEIAKLPSVEVIFNTAYVGCEQDESNRRVRVMVHETSADKDDDVTYSADWVVGTDGANSAVRRSLCIPFEGFSFTDFRMIGADIVYDYAKEEYGSVMNFIVDPEDWAVVIYTGQQHNLEAAGEGTPLYRIAYGEDARLSERKEDILERARERCSRYAKGRKVEVTRAEYADLMGGDGLS